MQRDRWPQRRAQLVAIMAPVCKNVTRHRGARLVRSRLDPPHLFLEVSRQGLGKTRKRLIQGVVGHHRRDHGTHPDRAVRFGNRIEPFARGHRILDEQIVGRRASLVHQLDGGQRGAQPFVLDRAAAVDDAARTEEDLERHEVAHRALAQAAVRMGVAVNQAGHEQSVGSLDRLDIVARDAPHRLDRSDETVLDEHVRWIARHKIRAQHTPAANQGAHAVSLPCAMCRPIS